MKQLIRRLSKVADSSNSLSSTSSSKPPRHRSDVPHGHLPVYVGDDLERFVVRADMLSRPIFVELLRRSAAEYGYEQSGVLRIPCAASLFRRVLQALRDGDDGDVSLPD
ncbi:hypothetical protein QJS10_CPB11g01541 [Acorus calamus]|uniref:Uncharacterized protein n=1 Tax=Acorus calamus TaxID=4465 RepID=A0AAV9DRX5_ACOCL|nr:hypothetical protein QJS10_CPB11g01541 [Acorus calamus]